MKKLTVFVRFVKKYSPDIYVMFGGILAGLCLGGLLPNPDTGVSFSESHKMLYRYFTDFFYFYILALPCFVSCKEVMEAYKEVEKEVEKEETIRT